MAEWLGRNGSGGIGYARANVGGIAPADLASAAVAARDAAHGARQRCTLALGGRLVDHRVIELPEIARGDLRDVLARKAAHALGCELSDALYAALPLGLHQHHDADGPQGRKWLLMCLRKSVLRPIEVECRRSGIELSQVISAPMARLCEAQRLRGDSEQACIVVDVDLDTVVVSLVQGTTLRHQNRIAGTFSTVATMALALVQELRTFDAFWRRASRGKGVTQVVVIGLDLERSRLFETAVTSALPDARVWTTPSEAEAETLGLDRADLPRAVALSACGTGGPFALEFRLALPPRPRTLIAAGSAVALVAALAGVTIKQRMSGELRLLQERRHASEVGSAALEGLEAENREAERLIGELQFEVDRLLRSRSVGIPVAPSLRAILTAVESNTELRTFSIERLGAAGSVRFAGLVDPDPMESIRALKAVERELGDGPLFDGVQVETSSFRETEATNAQQEFSGTARWEVQR